MELSKRLKAVAGLVTEGASVADIGTDHGYVPIWLIRSGRAVRVLAMDVNQGPLDRAREHICQEGLENVICTRRSDGLKELKPGEADTMIAAGMGGGLILRILEEAPDRTEEIREFILQPQSEISRVREYLNHHGFSSVQECMVEEEGKYYPMMKVIHGAESPYTALELRFGRLLLAERDPVLYRFLERERKIKEQILAGLAERSGRGIDHRKRELEMDLAEIRQAMDLYRE